MNSTPVRVSYFSDLLCIWAYVSQIRIDELRNQLKDDVQIEYHFVPVFGDVVGKIEKNWKERGGKAGYAEHVRSVVDGFEHVHVHPDVWRKVAPPSSASAHLFLKAVQVLTECGVVDSAPRSDYQGRTLFEELTCRMRDAFFNGARDISKQSEQYAVAAELKLPGDQIRTLLENGEAMAALMRDTQLCQDQGITGSPTIVLNEGRQKLFGNVGYRVIEANIREILRNPGNQASWC
ncbi:MAG: DsbA family protein [Leptospiraceae bacterium]|nr:DsbA family protein [Leptospiraceae bacterium]